jgi:hypothetical protein
MEVEADHIAHFVDEHRIGRELEGFLPMRLQAGMPDAPDRSLRQPGRAMARVLQCVASVASGRYSSVL